MISSTGVTTGNITAAAQAVTLNTNADQFVGVQLAGTFVATVQFEATIDGTTWYPLPLTPCAGGAAITSQTVVSLQSGTVAPYAQFRVRCSAFTSGTVVVSVIEANAGR